jgi:hypothetical protein
MIVTEKQVPDQRQRDIFAKLRSPPGSMRCTWRSSCSGAGPGSLPESRSVLRLFWLGQKIIDGLIEIIR